MAGLAVERALGVTCARTRSRCTRWLGRQVCRRRHAACQSAPSFPSDLRPRAPERRQDPFFASPNGQAYTGLVCVGVRPPYEYSSTKGIVFFAGKCIYEKGLFWLLLILSGAFFVRNFPSLAPRSGAFLPRKTSLARSKLPFPLSTSPPENEARPRAGRRP